MTGPIWQGLQEPTAAVTVCSAFPHLVHLYVPHDYVVLLDVAFCFPNSEGNSKRG